MSGAPCKTWSSCTRVKNCQQRTTSTKIERNLRAAAPRLWYTHCLLLYCRIYRIVRYEYNKKTSKKEPASRNALTLRNTKSTTRYTIGRGLSANLQLLYNKDRGQQQQYHRKINTHSTPKLTYCPAGLARTAAEGTAGSEHFAHQVAPLSSSPLHLL